MTITKTQIITWSLLAVVSIIVIIFLVRIFGGHKMDNSDYLKTIKAQDEAIRAKDSIIAIKNVENAALDKQVEDGNKLRDEYLKLIGNLQSKYKANDIKYQNIPIVIRGLSTKDSLRRAIIEP
jgi:hypothetical protein